MELKYGQSSETEAKLMNTAVKTTLIFIIVLSLPVCLNSQEEKPEPEIRETVSTQEREERLPEFELPEFIITGRAQFYLPSVEKRKIDEAYLYRVVSSGEMINRERDIETTSIGLVERKISEFEPSDMYQQGIVRLGYGRFNTPRATGRGGVGKGNFSLSGRFLLHDTGGFEPFAEEREIDVRLRLSYRNPGERSVIGGARTYLEVGIEEERYHPKIFTTMVPPGPFLYERKFESGHIEAGITSGGKQTFDYAGNIGWRASRITDIGLSRADEDEVYAGLRTLGYLGSVQIKTDFRAILNQLDLAQSNRNPLYGKGKVTALFPLYGEKVSIEVGGGFYGFRSTDIGFNSLLKPFAEVRYIPDRNFIFYTSYSPEVRYRSLYKFRILNRYIDSASQIRHTDELTDLRMGGYYIPHRNVTYHMYFHYLRANDYPAFSVRGTEGTWLVDYTGVTEIYSVNADLKYTPSESDIITLKFSWRHSENDEYRRAVPYLPTVEIGTVYTKEFPFGLRSSIGIEFIGSRPWSYLPSGSIGLDPFANVTLDVHYQFHNIMGIYFNFDNMFNSSYQRFQGYPERPFYLEGGVQLLW